MQHNIFQDITKGKNMDSKDKIILEQKEGIIALAETAGDWFYRDQYYEVKFNILIINA